MQFENFAALCIVAQLTLDIRMQTSLRVVFKPAYTETRPI
jgi:BarA-like signal transduction histidine kinase